MMKKITCFFLLAILILNLFSTIPAYALTGSDICLDNECKTIEILENGDYLETTLIIKDLDLKSSTKTGSKTKSYKNSSGVTLWSVTVHGTFSYTGTSSTCTNATRSTSAPGANWSIKSSSAGKSGNTATAHATATYRDGSYTTDYSMSVSLKCSANGTLS